MKKLMFVVAALSALTLNAETYTWTGDAGDNKTGTAGNWSVDGTTATKAPGKGDTVIFSNQEAITLSKSGELQYLKYEFRGADVALPKGSNLRQYGYGGGGITATGTGTYKFGYPLELNANQFTGENKTFVVDVGAGATVSVSDSGTTKIYPPANFIKRGAGTFKPTQFIPNIASSCGRLTFEAGTLSSDRPNDKNNYFGEFVVTGSEAKTMHMDAMNVWIDHYQETPDASCALEFYLTLNTGYAVNLTGAYDVPRFSADVTGDSSSHGNTLNWNPGEDKAITMVDRVWDCAWTQFKVTTGRMRFAEGAGIKNLKALTVASGAGLEIAESAAPCFSGAPIAMASGATLKIEGASTVFKPKSISYNGTAIPNGRYTAADFEWLSGDGVLVVGNAAGGITYYWKGAAGAKLYDVGNWSYASGREAPVTPDDGDTVIFTNDAPIAVNKNGQTSFRNYVFEGKSVDFSPNSDRFCFWGDGSLVVTEPSEIKMRYTFELNNDFGTRFNGSNRFTFDIGKGATVSQLDTGNFKLLSPAIVAKAGAGTLYARAVPADMSGTLVMIGGLFRMDYGGDREDALAALEVEGPDAKTLRIEGCHLTIKRYHETSEAEGSFSLAYEHNTRSITFACAEDTRLSADLITVTSGQHLQFKWAPTDATKTLTYVKRLLDQPATQIYVNGGTWRFAEGAGVRGLDLLSVVSGAVLEVAADASSNFSGAPLTLATGAMLKLEGTADRFIRFKSVTVGGTEIPEGLYTAADYPAWLSGDATLAVGSGEPPPTTATWTGNGGVDTSIANPANWGVVGTTELPDLTGGSLVATIPAGATVSVPADADCRLKGIVVDSGAQDTVSTISGPGTLKLGSQGLVNAGDGKVVLDCKVRLMVEQVWSLGSSLQARLTLAENAGIITEDGVVWTVHTDVETFGGDGGGLVEIRCANPRLVDSAFNVGVCVFADNALGLGTATLNGDNKPNYVLQLNGVTLANQEIRLEGIASSSSTRSFRNTGTNVIKGLFNVKAGSANYFLGTQGAILTLEGGVSFAAGTNRTRTDLALYDSSTIVVKTVPAALEKPVLTDNGTFRFETSGNVVRKGIFLGGDRVLTTTADHAFAFGATESSVAGIGFVAGTKTAKWDLAGTEQELQILAGVGKGTITSEQPATLTLDASHTFNGDQGASYSDSAPTFLTRVYVDSTTTLEVPIKEAQQTDNVSFRGAVSLVKKGASPHYAGGVSTSTGSLSVAGGRYVFLEGASWKTASGVALSNDGVLEVTSSGVLSAKTPISITGEENGRISIPSGKTLRCASLTVNGVMCAEGELLTSGVVTGGGTLKVGKCGGQLIIVR